MEEVWRPVVGFELQYAVSNKGKVMRVAPGAGSCPGKILKPQMCSRGYMRVCLSVNGKQKQSRVHVLVAQSFLGPKPYKYQVNHKDGDKTNNLVSNLEYVTQVENTTHAFRIGLIKPTKKLTKEQVSQIENLLNNGMLTQKKIGEMFQVSDRTIRSIKNKTY